MPTKRERIASIMGRYNNQTLESNLRIADQIVALSSQEISAKDKLLKLPSFPPVYNRGHLSIEADIKSLAICDFGIQISEDGRVWICINGQAFIRFKPQLSKEKQDEPRKP